MFEPTPDLFWGLFDALTIIAIIGAVGALIDFLFDVKGEF